MTVCPDDDVSAADLVGRCELCAPAPPGRFQSGDEPLNSKEKRMGKSIHIDDIPADGVELTEDDLANLIGGLPPRHDRSSQTLNYDVGMCDMDEDF